MNDFLWLELEMQILKKEFEDGIDTQYMMDYKLENHTGNKVILKKGSNGNSGIHIVLFLLTAWWTFCLRNLAYVLYSRSKIDEVILKIKYFEINEIKKLWN